MNTIKPIMHPNRPKNVIDISKDRLKQTFILHLIKLLELQFDEIFKNIYIKNIFNKNSFNIFRMTFYNKGVRAPLIIDNFRN